VSGFALDWAASDHAMSLQNLALIGNGTVSALIDGTGRISWACFPRFDGDPTFCSLLRSDRVGEADFGHFSVEISDAAGVEQQCVRNTPVLRTRLHDTHGGSVEITDFAPRYRQYGRIFAPMMLVRQIVPSSGNPRIRIRFRPARGYGREPMPMKRGSNHITYEGDGVTLRFTSNAPVTAVLEEIEFFLDSPLTILLGPDETVGQGVVELGRHMLEETVDYWRTWVRALAVPFEWQEAVITAAIALKLNVFEDTGAIIAAATTSIPEAPGTMRNWDYRYCWIRDAYFVVNALNRLGATRIMERYLAFTLNIIAMSDGARLRPLYGISGQGVPNEVAAPHLDGYRGMGPVRIGNQASHQIQHDVYGAAILTAPHVFFDQRLDKRGDADLFSRLEHLGFSAAELFNQPDAGIWELRGTQRVHTFSSVMCWAGCDRLARIAHHIGLADRAKYWQAEALRIRNEILERSWSSKLNSFTGSMEGSTLDASLLRLNEIGFIAADDPRFLGTVAAIERDLRRGEFIYRYSEEDDFGAPTNAFVVCTFWYINALAAIGRKDEARELFENILSCRNSHGLLSEDIDPETREQWGNFVQTYSMVGIIDSAARLSKRWEDVY
jgi:GH15 family glucan-1,4-alpha-glucosidase